MLQLNEKMADKQHARVKEYMASFERYRSERRGQSVFGRDAGEADMEPIDPPEWIEFI